MVVVVVVVVSYPVGRGRCCCDNESSVITLVPCFSVEIGEILISYQFNECDLDGQTDGQMVFLTDKSS